MANVDIPKDGGRVCVCACVHIHAHVSYTLRIKPRTLEMISIHFTPELCLHSEECLDQSGICSALLCSVSRNSTEGPTPGPVTDYLVRV